MTLRLFITLLFFSHFLSAQQAINSVIGDTSWLATYGEFPPTQLADHARITTHLNYVVQRLKVNSNLVDSVVQAKRNRLIELLENYVQRGQFPQNTAYTNERKPCFIDEEGTICAVGYLVEQTAGRVEAERINSIFQYDRISAMQQDTGLIAWQRASGLSLQELAMIQPEYWPSPPPNYQPVVFYDSLKQKYGIKNQRTGLTAVKAKYDEIIFLEYRNIGQVRIDDKWALMGYKGKVYSDFQYDAIDFTLSKYDVGKIRIGDKWGFIDHEGKTLGACIYDEIKGNRYSDSYLFYAKKEGRISIFSHKGKLLDKRTFDAVKERKGAIQVQLNGKWGTLDGVPMIYKSIELVGEPSYGNTYYKVLGEKGYGILHTNRKHELATLIPEIHQYLKYVGFLWLGKIGDKKIAYDWQGKESVIKNIEELITYPRPNISVTTHCVLVRVAGKYGLLDGLQRWAIPPAYDQITQLNESYNIVMKEGKRGVYNNKRQLIIPTEYDSIRKHGWTNFITWKKGKVGMYNQVGQLEIPVVYDTITPLLNYSYAVRDNDKWEIKTEMTMNEEGNMRYDSIYKINEYLFTVTKEDKSYFGELRYNKEFELYIHTETPFQSVQVMQDVNRESIIRYQQGLKFGLITKKYNMNPFEYTTPASFDTLLMVSHRLFLIKQEGKYGLINPKGKIMISPTYMAYRELKQKTWQYPIYLKDEKDWYIVESYGKKVTKLPSTHFLYQEN